MTEAKTAGIPSETKIIVGASHSESTGWYSLHLHDALFALSVRPDQKLIIIDEGQGRHRVQQMTFPFENVLSLKVVRWPFGHECVGTPAGDNLNGDSATALRSFAPVMVQLLIKHATSTDFLAVHDLGATPTPVLIPQLKAISAERMKTAGTELSSAEDCAALADKVTNWVREVNRIIRKERGVQQIAAAGGVKPPHYHEVQEIVQDLPFCDDDVQQSLYGGVAALFVTIELVRLRQQKRLKTLRRPARIESSFPLTLMRPDNDRKKNLSVDDLVHISQRYYEETRRPIAEAFTTISDHVKDFKSRAIDSSDKLSIFEDITPRDFQITDPTMMINERGRVFGGLELQHKEQLERVFENEGIEVHYIEGLPFLSLLVSYETEDGERHHAVIIKEGPQQHPALKQFLLAHELGHWFLHIKNKERTAGIAPFLRSSGKETFLEKQADTFGLSVLFPPEYLSDWIFLKGEEPTVEGVYAEFVAGMTPPPGDRLKAEMHRCIGEMLEKHQSFQRAQEPKLLTLDIKWIEEKNLQPLLDVIHSGDDNSYWVRLDNAAGISDASENVKDLFGRSRDELVGESPLELVIEEERERMGLRTEFRKHEKKAIIYMTEVINTKTNRSRPVMVYSFPILDPNSEYVGAMAAIRPLDQLREQADQ